MQRVSEMRCCVWDLSCNGMTQVHHLLKPWIGERGMSLRADDRNVIPLCLHHHQQLHDRFGNEFKFFESHFLAPTFGQVLARRLWENYENDKAD